jgi:tetratricopeptide (TPR) repeat protein
MFLDFRTDIDSEQPLVDTGGRRRADRRLIFPRFVALIALVVTIGPSEVRSEVGNTRPETVDSASISLQSFQDLLRQGLDHYARGDLDGASRVWHRIREDYPDHPAGPLFEAHTLAARKDLNFQDDRYNEQLRANASAALALAEAWLKRVPDDARAHYYAGQAKFQLVILDGSEGRYYSAGVAGEQAREHLERAIELDPGLVDAKLPLGNYYYYASVATRFIRWLSWLWFIPTGERELGLAYVEEVSREGDRLRYDATAQLARIYLYLEDQPACAAPILTSLHNAYPENTQLAFEMVEVNLVQEDYAAAVKKALEIEQSGGTQFGDAIRRTLAKIWRARAELYRNNVDRAGGILDEIDEGVDLPVWGRRWLFLTKAHLEDIRGHRAAAVAYYERVMELKSRWDSSQEVELAEQGLDEPFRSLPPGTHSTDGDDPRAPSLCSVATSKVALAP